GGTRGLANGSFTFNVGLAFTPDFDRLMVMDIGAVMSIMWANGSFILSKSFPGSPYGVVSYREPLTSRGVAIVADSMFNHLVVLDTGTLDVIRVWGWNASGTDEWASC